MLKELVFWEKFRPNTLNPEKGKKPIILLPRIKKIVDNGIKFNMILVGAGGLGKSSCADILVQDCDYRRIGSNERGVDTIEIIEEHCRNFSLPLRKTQKGNPQGQKVVWLEEFDQTTPDFRRALRGFIEEHPYVRFIATANNINKIGRSEEDKALLSRFNIIDFNPNGKEEVEFLKKNQMAYLKSIAKSVQFEVPEEVLSKLISRTFPNFRSTVQLLQEVYISGDFDTYLKQKDKQNVDVYQYMLNGNNVVSENYFYVMDNFPKEKTEDLLESLSGAFFKYLMDNHQEILLKNGFKILKTIKDYNAQYTQTADPETHLVSMITELKEIL